MPIMKSSTGYNANVSTSYEVVSNVAGGVDLAGIKAQALNGGTLNVISSDAADDLDSTGMEIVGIGWVDDNWNERYSLVTLNGAANVALSTAARGVLSAKGIQYGSGAANAGIISVNDDEGAPRDLLSIPIGANASNQLTFLVPNGRKCTITSISAAISGASTTCVVKLSKVSDAGVQQVLMLANPPAAGGTVEITPNIEIDQKHIVVVEGITTVADDAVTINVLYELS